MQALPGWAVIETEEKTMEGTLYIPDSAKTDMQQGIIVSVDNTFVKSATHGPIVIKQLVAGVKVLYKKYHDSDLEIKGKKYKVVPIDQIMVIL